MIDFDSSEPVVLLNPRLPRSVVEDAARRVDRASCRGGLIWLATSGSSGPSKLVALGRDALLVSAESVNAHLRSTSDDTWLLALPTFHVGGLGILARAHASGARVVQPFRDRGWSAREFLAAAARETCRLSALVPAQLADLVETGERCPASLRAIVIGGGAVDVGLLGRARELGYPALPSYGLTECASQVATASLDSIDADGPSVLRTLDHVEARRSAAGRLEIKSRALLDGYLLSSGTGEALHDPKTAGWFETEDRGTVDGDVVHVLGRDRGFLKIGGESVDLNRLEVVLERLRRVHLGDGDAALTAEHDERLGHSLAMAVASGASDEAIKVLRESYDAEVLPFERIRRVFRVERIPRSELGKPRLGELLNRDE
jgi:o-succinylbenzoate---CoA ligase